MKEGLPTFAMQDEQHMLVVSASRVLVVTDVGAELRPQPDEGFRSLIPLKIEADGPSIRKVKAFAIGGGHQSAMLLAPSPPAAAAALFADPEQEPLVDREAAGHGEIDEEAVGFQIVGDVPAVIAGILRTADVGPGGSRRGVQRGAAPRAVSEGGARADGLDRADRSFASGR